MQSINSFRTNERTKYERTEGQTRAFDTTLRQHKLTPQAKVDHVTERSDAEALDFLLRIFRRLMPK